MSRLGQTIGAVRSLTQRLGLGAKPDSVPNPSFNPNPNPMT